MDSSFRAMTTSRDAPNPLRPYYIPPSVGVAPDASAKSHNASGGPSLSSASNPRFGASARDILADLDYGEYLSESSPSVVDVAKRLLDQAVWSYSSVLMAQPFEVAKTILQCHHAGDRDLMVAAPGEALATSGGGYDDGRGDDDASDSEGDSPAYFSSTAPTNESFPFPSQSSSSPAARRRQVSSRSNSATSTPSHQPSSPPERLELRRPDALLEVLSQLWARESVWGVWKGTNATFVYGFLLKTIESWTRSLLAAVINVPDPGLMRGGGGMGGLNVMDGPSPMASLAVVVAAAGVAGIVLAPLDLARTRLILTPISSPPRTLIPSLRQLDSFAIPIELLPPTIVHTTVPRVISASTPLLVRNLLRVDPFLAPATYNLCAFLSAIAELFVKLPLETVLRRAQAAVLRRAHDDRMHASYGMFRRSSGSGNDTRFRTVVEIGPYRGVVGTLWYIAREEGSSVSPVESMKARTVRPAHDGAPAGRRVTRTKGQGVHGLWRGWRVGFWGLVGVWGAAALGGAGSGGEF